MFCHQADVGYTTQPSWDHNNRKHVTQVSESGSADIQYSGRISDGIKYRLMTLDDVDIIKSMLYSSFFKEDPLEVSLQLESPREARGFVEPSTLQIAKHGVSIVAVDIESNKLVGCRLSVFETPLKEMVVNISRENEDTVKLCIVMDFLHTLNDGVDLFEMYKVDKIMRFKAINVLSEYSGRGIGKRLIEESLALAREQGVRLAVAEATGKYSQRLYDKFGFDVIKEISYSDYKVNGKQVFTKTGVHTSCRLVAKLL